VDLRRPCGAGWVGAVILVNKQELVSAEQLARVVAMVRRLNADALILPTSYSDVPLTAILNTRRFSLERAQEAAGWLQQLRFVWPSPRAHIHRCILTCAHRLALG
jgi:G3E family GTPase